MKKILWMDNDQAFLTAHKWCLVNAHYSLVHTKSLKQAEKLVSDENWDLVLVDIMMNVKADDEHDYPPSRAENGHSAGIVFIERIKQQVEEMNGIIAVLTMRADNEAFNRCSALGITKDRYRYKMEVSDPDDFLEWIESCMLLTGDQK